MALKILHLSDTHGVHRRLRDLPEADILVHSGDFTKSGSEAVLQEPLTGSGVNFDVIPYEGVVNVIYSGKGSSSRSRPG